METEYKVEYLQLFDGNMRTVGALFKAGQYRNPERAALGYAEEINRGETGRPPNLLNKEAKVYKRHITDWEEYE